MKPTKKQLQTELLIMSYLLGWLFAKQKDGVVYHKE